MVTFKTSNDVFTILVHYVGLEYVLFQNLVVQCYVIQLISFFSHRASLINHQSVHSWE